ncbi:MAG: hypothetical protein LBV40_01525 [Methanomicrobiales archaeon]|nr:hypothetical protein [Methanomicrobiales archaeon]
MNGGTLTANRIHVRKEGTRTVKLDINTVDVAQGMKAVLNFYDTTAQDVTIGTLQVHSGSTVEFKDNAEHTGNYTIKNLKELEPGAIFRGDLDMVDGGIQKITFNLDSVVKGSTTPTFTIYGDANYDFDKFAIIFDGKIPLAVGQDLILFQNGHTQAGQNFQVRGEEWISTDAIHQKISGHMFELRNENGNLIARYIVVKKEDGSTEAINPGDAKGIRNWKIPGNGKIRENISDGFTKAENIASNYPEYYLGDSEYHDMLSGLMNDEALDKVLVSFLRLGHGKESVKKRKAIQTLVEYFSFVMGIDNPPKILIRHDIDLPTQYYPSTKINTIYLNVNILERPFEVITSIVHELTHAWQTQVVLRTIEEIDRDLYHGGNEVQYYQELADPIKSGKNVSGYLTHLTEIEARTSEDAIAERMRSLAISKGKGKLTP